METKNKLAQSMSAEELIEFLALLAQTPGVDGPMIQRLAAERGIEIGHNSANHFRKEVFGKYLEKLSKRKQLARVVAEHSDDGAGRRLADAAADELSQMIFEHLAEGQLDLSDDEDMARAAALAAMLKGLRSEDRKMIAQLTAELAALRKREKESRDDLRDSNLSEEDRAARMRARFGV